MKKANLGAVFILTLVVALLGVGSSPTETSVSQQTSITPPPSYVPPICKGKPITVVPREVALAQTPTELKSNTPIAQGDQLQLFDTLAKTINEVYLYPDFNGFDWSSIVAEYRARVAAGLATEAFYSEMEQFVSQLGDKHSYFESPVKAAEHRTTLAGQDKLVGIGALFNPVLERSAS
jgi:hypothetical protein